MNRLRLHLKYLQKYPLSGFHGVFGDIVGQLKKPRGSPARTWTSISIWEQDPPLPASIFSVMGKLVTQDR